MVNACITEHGRSRAHFGDLRGTRQSLQVAAKVTCGLSAWSDEQISVFRYAGRVLSMACKQIVPVLLHRDGLACMLWRIQFGHQPWLPLDRQPVRVVLPPSTSCMTVNAGGQQGLYQRSVCGH